MLKDVVLTSAAVAQREHIAGIPRSKLFGSDEFWTGFREIGEERLLALFQSYLEFRPRNEETEVDSDWKQVIPYFLVRRDNQYFNAKRRSTAGDVRLHGARLIGFGGHLRASDISGPISEWLRREFEEEMEVSGKVMGISFLGVVNDDSDANKGVGKVHFGLVFMVDVEGDVKIREGDSFEPGEFMTVDKLRRLGGEMESWSQIVLGHISEP